MSDDYPAKTSVTRLYLLSHAPTAAQRALCFPADEGIEGLAPDIARKLMAHIGSCAALWRGPERRAAETAQALGITAEPVPDLRAWSVGSWTGRSIAWVAEHEPAGFGAWLTDPDASPGGGESLTELLARVSTWLEAESNVRGRALVIADPAVIRAALVHALDAGSRVFWRLDVPPFSLSVLQHTNGEWRVRGLNVEAQEAPND